MKSVIKGKIIGGNKSWRKTKPMGIANIWSWKDRGHTQNLAGTADTHGKEQRFVLKIDSSLIQYIFVTVSTLSTALSYPCSPHPRSTFPLSKNHIPSLPDPLPFLFLQKKSLPKKLTKQYQTRYNKTRQKSSYKGWPRQPIGGRVPSAEKRIRDTPASIVSSPIKTPN